MQRTAKRVDALGVEAEHLDAVRRLRGERLVQLKDVDLVLLEADLLQHLGDRHRRAYTRSEKNTLLKHRERAAMKRSERAAIKRSERAEGSVQAQDLVLNKNGTHRCP